NLVGNSITAVDGRPLFAAAYDLVSAPLERAVLSPARARLLAGAAGRVLEVGAGTGANLPWYPAGLDTLDLCEPDPFMRRRLERRVAARAWPFPVRVHAVGAEGPFPAEADDGYDLVVSTLVLCTVPDPQAAARAVRRALAEGGRVAYLEHVHVGGLAGRVQTLLSPWWGRVAGGCHLDRPATAALRSAGLVPVEQRWIRLPPPLGLAVAGQAIIRRRPPYPGPPTGSA
ncbi:MAG: methyltransferase domain-containing protein, partial [Acidimicrobiales bacterium]